MSTPYFSIIVVSFNAESLIKDTINSVLNQTFKNFEIIVKDAKSIDNTLNNIPSDDRIHVYSENDLGIYDGMNEAISYSNGKYLTFLNCGDYFENDHVLEEIYKNTVSLKNTFNIAYGNYKKGDTFVKQPSTISSFFLYRNTLCHQSVFFGKELFDQLGNYNLNYKICADYEFITQCYVNKADFIYVPITTCFYLPNGFSENKKNRKQKKQEHNMVVKKYFPFAKRFKYAFVQFITLKGLRVYLSSDKSPAFLRKTYRALINKINK